MDADLRARAVRAGRYSVERTAIACRVGVCGRGRSDVVHVDGDRARHGQRAAGRVVGSLNNEIVLVARRRRFVINLRGIGDPDYSA